MRPGNLFHAFRQKAVREIGHGTGIGRNLHNLLPLPFSVARFFHQLPFGGLQGRFSGFHHPAGQLVACHAHGMPILPLHHKLAFCGYGNHIHPVRVFHYIVFGIYAAVRQLYFVSSGREPGPSNQVFRGQDFPLFRIVFGVHFLYAVQSFKFRYFFLFVKRFPIFVRNRT